MNDDTLRHNLDSSQTSMLCINNYQHPAFFPFSILELYSRFQHSNISVQNIVALRSLNYAFPESNRGVKTTLK